jgi:thiamine biosynthesis lipoprotein
MAMIDEPRLSRREVLKRAGAVASVVPLFGLTAAGKQGEGLVELSGPTMGTTWSVKLAGALRTLDPHQLQVAIERALERVNEQMSTYRADSELSRFNMSRATGWFAVSPETQAVIAEALHMSRLSHGAFDVTIGPLVNAWGFGPPHATEAANNEPDAARIASLLERVDTTTLRTRRRPPAIAKRHPGVCVDLCGIAKGFGVDQVATLLDRAGLTRYLIEIGGELRGRGARPGGGPWLAGIERPIAGETAVYRVIRLDSRALATSGDYRSFFKRDGVRYSHIIDPRTGRPVIHSLASVSVLACTAMEADAMSTALMVLGEEAGWQLARQHHVAAMFIARRGEDFVERRTPEFKGLVVGEP